jgi:hypothetical protein
LRPQPSRSRTLSWQARRPPNPLHRQLIEGLVAHLDRDRHALAVELAGAIAAE